MMKKRRHRVIDPRKVRIAAGGGGGSFYDRITPTPEVCCGECQQLRNSVDGSGECGYCRAKNIRMGK